MNEPIQQITPLTDGVCVELQGDIDLSRSPDVRVALMREANTGHQRITVGLSHVPYMDSSGVATLIEAMQHQRKKGGIIVLFGMQPKVRSIFEIAKLDSVFTIVEDAEAAQTV